jgi:ribosome biogenesis GTPase / thiamine phosphate phosphatase
LGETASREHASRASLIEGTVVENRGSLFEVVVEGRSVMCLLRGKLKKEKQRQVSPVAAGDRVRLALLEPGRGVIEEVLPRTSDLSRRAAGSVPLQHTLAANVDQALVVFAVAEPRCDFYMLDRFLLAAGAGGLERIICFNKCDLLPEAERQDQFHLYAELGFRVFYTSAYSGEGLEPLREAMRDRSSVICGPSGVGKSSLLNALASGLTLRVAGIGYVTHKGRHTTTSITLLPLPFGGWVADTPGLRQLNLDGLTHAEVMDAFPDLQPHTGGCTFSDCSHRHETGCGVRAAAAAGKIHPRRMKSYVQLRGGVR